MSAPCRGYNPRSGTPCARPSTVVAIVGCKHEHVSPRDLCDSHLDDARRGQMHCGECLELGHVCVLKAHNPVAVS